MSNDEKPRRRTLQEQVLLDKENARKEAKAKHLQRTRRQAWSRINTPTKES